MAYFIYLKCESDLFSTIWTNVITHEIQFFKDLVLHEKLRNPVCTLVRDPIESEIQINDTRVDLEGVIDHKDVIVVKLWQLLVVVVVASQIQTCVHARNNQPIV